jgi:hypothetical protein
MIAFVGRPHLAVDTDLDGFRNVASRSGACALRSEADVDLIGQTYVKLARSFDPAKTQVRRRLPAGGRWIRTLGPPRKTTT